MSKYTVYGVAMKRSHFSFFHALADIKVALEPDSAVIWDLDGEQDLANRFLYAVSSNTAENAALAASIFSGRVISLSDVSA